MLALSRMFRWRLASTLLTRYALRNWRAYLPRKTSSLWIPSPSLLCLIAYSSLEISSSLSCSPSPNKVGSKSGFFNFKLFKSLLRASRSEKFFLIKLLIFSLFTLYSTLGRILLLYSGRSSTEFERSFSDEWSTSVLTNGARPDAPGT